MCLPFRVLQFVTRTLLSHFSRKSPEDDPTINTHKGFQDRDDAEESLGSISVDTIRVPKPLCIFTALRVTSFSTRGGRVEVLFGKRSAP